MMTFLSDMALQFEAKKMALKQNRNGFVLTLVLHPDEIPEELIRDFVGARYACALVRINDDESPVHYDNSVKEAGMLCRSPAFQRYLADTSNMVVEDEDGAAAALCILCGISSRSELNGNQQAIAAFKEIVRGFKNDAF